MKRVAEDSLYQKRIIGGRGVDSTRGDMNQGTTSLKFHNGQVRFIVEEKTGERKERRR